MNNDIRKKLACKKRIVIKIGTGVITQKTGRLNINRIRSIVNQIAGLKNQGRKVILVSSGAIGAGIQALGMHHRPEMLAELQIAASVGQTRLMASYDKFFSQKKCTIGQVLLTHDDLKHRTRHLNARNTLMRMIKYNIIPIINENDAVAVNEIKFGDNDLLASLVVHLIEADALVLLTASDGVRKAVNTRHSSRIPIITDVNSNIRRLAEGKYNKFSTGGMITKLDAAKSVIDTGGCAVIADGRKTNVLIDIFNCKDTGTLFIPRSHKPMPSKKRWIAFFQTPAGSLTVDNGAVKAIKQNGKSLLPIGIKKVNGRFKAGAAVDVQDANNHAFARGLVDYSSSDIQRIMGHRTSEINKILGTNVFDDVIHRDNMVLL
jgi:glutamate 5-kinase